MIIANPIYDVVFKLLMQDLDIAKALLSSVLGEEIQHLQFAAHERVMELTGERESNHSLKQLFRNLCMFRMDFVAVVKMQTGEEKEILIELQKARLASDIQRFRQYLSLRYQEVVEDEKDGGPVTRQSLPIVMIVLLGFNVDQRLPAGVHISRQYRNLFTQEPLEVRSDFVEKLTHDLYLVQAKKLRRGAGPDAERLLSVFSQQGFTDETEHLLEYPDEEAGHQEMLRRMLHVLSRLSRDAEMRAQMRLEDEMYWAVVNEIRQQTAELERRAAQDRREAEEHRLAAEEARRQAEQSREREAAATQWAQDASRLADEERRQKEEERRLKEEERRQKEAALALVDQERLETERRLKKILETLVASGMPESEARRQLGLE